MKHATAELRDARDFLLRHRTDYETAYVGFRWPRPEYFNFALDWIDRIARENDREALRIVADDGTTVSRNYSALSRASNRIANFLRAEGARRGDVILIMLGNIAPLWETMLAAMKLGIVMVPATPLLSRHDLQDRISRANARFVVAVAEFTDRFDDNRDWVGISVGGRVPGWLAIEDADACSSDFEPDARTAANDPLLLYFTSGTASKPKLVLHSHISYPIGHLSTMYWLGLMPGDVHLNISSPGWAKHAWSSVFAPWLAEATVLALNHSRFGARATLDAIVRERATTICAPPTVWRMLIQEDLSKWKPLLREAASAGEPLNPEVISKIGQVWGLTIRDGFGQTETSALIGNTPGQRIIPGAVGRPLPGFKITLRDDEDGEAQEAEISVELGPQWPVGLMQGYQTEDSVMAVNGEIYRTGDVAKVNEHGTYTYIGRADDVFKASDYRISPFELESVLLEHPAVGEAAVVPSPDLTRLAVPKAFVSLAPGFAADAQTARAILSHVRDILGPFKRVRRIEFFDLPKTISGKIRRVELRKLEALRRSAGEKGAAEWSEEDFSGSA